jgi:hypothetical protein
MPPGTVEAGESMESHFKMQEHVILSLSQACSAITIVLSSWMTTSFKNLAQIRHCFLETGR